MKYLPLVLALTLLVLISPGYSDEESDDPEIREFVRLAKAQRRKIGCPELKWDNRLARLAWAHSRDMAEEDFFSHTNSQGKDPFDRLKEANISYSLAAENIAYAQKKGKAVFETWLKSPAHRKNMLDCRFTRHGVGREGDRWTHILLKP